MYSQWQARVGHNAVSVKDEDFFTTVKDATNKYSSSACDMKKKLAKIQGVVGWRCT